MDTFQTKVEFLTILALRNFSCVFFLVSSSHCIWQRYVFQVQPRSVNDTRLAKAGWSQQLTCCKVWRALVRVPNLYFGGIQYSWGTWLGEHQRQSHCLLDGSGLRHFFCAPPPRSSWVGLYSIESSCRRYFTAVFLHHPWRRVRAMVAPSQWQLCVFPEGLLAARLGA